MSRWVLLVFLALSTIGWVSGWLIAPEVSPVAAHDLTARGYIAATGGLIGMFVALVWSEAP